MTAVIARHGPAEPGYLATFYGVPLYGELPEGFIREEEVTSGLTGEVIYKRLQVPDWFQEEFLAWLEADQFAGVVSVGVWMTPELNTTTAGEEP